MNWDAFAAFYLGGATVAACIGFLAYRDETDVPLDLALIFLWPLMMALLVSFSVWDEYQKIKEARRG